MSIRKGAMMQEPLLQKKAELKASKSKVIFRSEATKQDLETGKSENFQEQVKTCCKGLTPATISWFVIQPDNWAACGIMLCYAWTIWVFWIDGMVGGTADQNIFSGIYGIQDTVDVNGTQVTVTHHHWTGVFAGLMCTAGLSIGVVYMLRKTQLIDQINQFRDLNRKYDANVTKLTSQCELLTKTNDDLKLELSNFSDLQGAIKAYAEKNGKDFTEIFKKSAEIFEGISKVQDDEQRLLLQRCVADVQFLDRRGGDGVSKREFTRFEASLPAQYKAKLQQLGITFEVVSKNKEEADTADMKEVLDKLLEGVSQAPAS